MSYWYRRGYWRGGGYGRGLGFGRGMGMGGGRGMGGGGWGRGNPSPYCRWYPNLPRGWWRFSPDVLEQWGIDTSNLPFPPAGGWDSIPYQPSVSPVPMAYPQIPPDQEKKYLEVTISQIETELQNLRKRMQDLDAEIQK